MEGAEYERRGSDELVEVVGFLEGNPLVEPRLLKGCHYRSHHWNLNRGFGVWGLGLRG